MAVRVVDDADLRRTIDQTNAANQMMDGVGLVAYSPAPDRKKYVLRKVPRHLELDAVLTRVCTALKNLP